MRDGYCPLCGRGPWPATLKTSTGRAERAAHACRDCGLVYVHSSALPTREAEIVRYREHNNDPEDPGYTGFLARILDLMEPVEGEGLDFGCGPEPVLSGIVRKRGGLLHYYDPLSHPNRRLLQQRYSWITCTEVAEHFHEPMKMFRLLDSMLLPGGSLGLMTRLLEGEEQLCGWHYAADHTHVCFYSEATIRWIARKFGWGVSMEGRDLILFRKSF